MNCELLDLLLPRYCKGCGRRLTSKEKCLCLHCVVKLPRTGLWREPEENVLARSFWGRTGGAHINKVAAYLSYGKTTTVGRIVHAFKYKNDKTLARDMGRLMAQELSAEGFFEDIDCLVPVPLTFWRRFRRGYNQAEWLARGVGEITGLPVCSGILRRKRFDGSQTMLSSRERQENVAGAFVMNQEKAENLKGKHILIIDDVITTGATTRECASQLAKVPDVKISILALATVQTAELRTKL